MKSASSHTFEQFNEEINEFYKYLKDNKYTDEEIRKILTPLRPNFKNQKLAALFLTCATIITFIYFATYVETISWHFSALARISLIKLLPFWNWPTLKNEKCLIARTRTSTSDEIRFNCDLCENIQQIDVYQEISGDLLKNRYIDVDVPAIIKKSFPKSDTFFADLFQNREISTSRPCRVSTNIHNGVPTVKDLLLKTELFDSFYMHFQNCDFPAMKEFRGFTPRPPFLPPELSPVQYNWLLWSKNYNVTQFKYVELVEKVALVGQIFGGNFVRLVPRNNCEGECPVVEVLLKEGESLVFTSLWNLEYRPDSGENVAAILEMH